MARVCCASLRRKRSRAGEPLRVGLTFAKAVTQHCLRHIHLGSDSCCFFRASCFSTCLVRTLPQENFAPSLIRSKIASSPSRLRVVRFLRSTISLRPPRSWQAFLQLVRSSPTQGPRRVPSTTSLRSDRVSTTEILNMLLNLDIATRLPKPRFVVP